MSRKLELCNFFFLSICFSNKKKAVCQGICECFYTYMCFEKRKKLTLPARITILCVGRNYKFQTFFLKKKKYQKKMYYLSLDRYIFYWKVPHWRGINRRIYYQLEVSKCYNFWKNVTLIKFKKPHIKKWNLYFFPLVEFKELIIYSIKRGTFNNNLAFGKKYIEKGKKILNQR